MGNLNQAGIDLIKSFEKCSLNAYPDPATKGEPYTIGWGHTGGIKPSDVWSQDEADKYLTSDLAKVCQKLHTLIHVPLNDNEFSALVALSFNIGLGNFSSSSLLRYLNAGGVIPASKEFIKWNHANGEVMAGLTRRREAENKLFLTNC